MQVMNSDFLACLAESAPEGTSLWVNAFPGEPDFKAPWGGHKYIKDQTDVDSLVNRNTYYSVAALAPVDGVLARKNQNFARLLVLVADDPDITKLNGEPSFIIETSPGKYQVGLFISADDKDAENIGIVNGLLSAMANIGLISADTSGNNAVRYCRLPVGCNQKSRDTGEFQHVLRSWNPENEFSLSDAAEVFGVTLDNVQTFIAQSSVYEPQDSKLGDAVAGIIAGVGLHDNINKVAGSLVASGLNGGAATNLLRSLMNQSSRKHSDHNVWQERFDGVSRAVTSAEKFRVEQHQPEQIIQETEHVYDLSVLKPVEFVIDGFISNKITVIAGAPGVGKTSLLVPLAFHAAHLCDPESEIKPILRRRVIYVTEDADQVERIIYGICKHESLKEPSEGYRYWFRIENARRKAGEDIADFIAKIRNECSISLGTQHNNYIVEPLIVLDTSNATIDLDNENDNAEAGKVIASIKSALGRSAIWLVAHTSKVTSKSDVENMSARGAGAFEGDANAVAYLLDIEGSRFLSLGKRRFEADYTDMRFDSYANSENVLTPWGKMQTVKYRYGIPYISSAAERIEVKEFGEKASKIATKSKLRQKVLETLANDGDLCKSKLLERVQGKKTIFLEVIEDLMAQGLVSQYKGARNADVLHVINPRPYRTNGD